MILSGSLENERDDRRDWKKVDLFVERDKCFEGGNLARDGLEGGLVVAMVRCWVDSNYGEGYSSGVKTKEVGDKEGVGR